MDPVKVIGYYGHYGPSRYLLHLHREFGRLGTDPDRLSETLRKPLHEITDWLDNPVTEGMEHLYDYRHLSLRALVERAQTETPGHASLSELPKPRIAVSMEITSKDDLSVRWRTNHVSLRYGEVQAPEWIWPPSTDHAIGRRPTAELMFIRGYGNLASFYRWGPDNPTDRAICILLAMAGASATENLIERLKLHFNIQVLNRLRF